MYAEIMLSLISLIGRNEILESDDYCGTVEEDDSLVPGIIQLYGAHITSWTNGGENVIVDTFTMG